MVNNKMKAIYEDSMANIIPNGNILDMSLSSQKQD